MAHALNARTARLPVVEGAAPATPGRTTGDCIALGCGLALTGLVAQAFARFDPEGRRRWLMTGGAAPTLLDAGAGLPAMAHRPQLVLEGLVAYASKAGWPP